MKFIKELFSESGSVSMMRVMSLISLLMGCYLASVGKDTSVSIFLSAAFLGKAGQKYFELSKQRPPEDK